MQHVIKITPNRAVGQEAIKLASKVPVSNLTGLSALSRILCLCPEKVVLPKQTWNFYLVFCNYISLIQSKMLMAEAVLLLFQAYCYFG